MSDKFKVALLFLALIKAFFVVSADARNVNISNAWVLPEEGFPVFYRYFRDRISWYEADAVCQFHHGNLVTVDSPAQYDGLRAFLKELDIVNNVWIGLIRNHLDGEFSWTDENISRDYRALSHEGYWAESLPATGAPLCAASDPVRDFRWHALNCGGAEVASFVCELAVPHWASACLVRSIPSLTAVYLPEETAVELTSNCGDVGGVKRVTCRGEQDRPVLVKQLSCGLSENDFSDNGISQSSSPSSSSTTSASSSSTGTKSWRFTSMNSIEELAQTRHRRETEDSSSVHSDWSSTMPSAGSKAKKEPKIGKDIDELEELPHKEHGVKGDLGLEDVMMGDQPRIEPASFLETVTVDEEVAKLPTIDASTMTEASTVGYQSPETSLMSSIATTSNPAVTTVDHGDQHGIKSPMIHFKSDEKHMNWTDISIKEPSFEPVEDHFIPPMLLVKTKFNGQEAKTNDVTTQTNHKQVSIERNDHDVTTTNNMDEISTQNVVVLEEVTNPIIQNVLETENANTILSENIYSIIENGTTVDILELNETANIEEKTTDDPVLNAASKSIEDNVVVRDADKVDKSTKAPAENDRNQHKVVEVVMDGLVAGAASYFSSIVITTRPDTVDRKKEKLIESKPNEQHVEPKISVAEAEIDPKIQILNLNVTKTNNDSEFIDNLNFTDKNIEIREQILPKSLREEEVYSTNVPEISTVEPETGSFQQAEMEPSEDIEPEPEPLHRPNRRRALARPQHHSNYPSLIKRVLG